MEIEMKHSPGSWVFESDISDKEQAVMDSLGCLVAVVNASIPNARLIVAAPEMIAALELILNDDRLMNAASSAQTQAVLMAVRKAKGA